MVKMLSPCNYMQVFFFDGTVPCFAGSHLIVAVPSLLLIIIVLLVPAFVLLISFRRFKVTNTTWNQDYYNYGQHYFYSNIKINYCLCHISITFTDNSALH